MKAHAKGSGPWKEVLLVLLVLLAFVAFAVSILDSQAEVGEERAGLMSLRENWGAAAASYGLRNGARSSSSSFLVEYRAFRSRPAFQKLLAADPVFLSLSVQADWALGELEEAQFRGDPEAGRYAGIFDRALGDMNTTGALTSAKRCISSGVNSVPRIIEPPIRLAWAASITASIGPSWIVSISRLRPSARASWLRPSM